MKVQEYRLAEEFKVTRPGYVPMPFGNSQGDDATTLPQGAFIKPIWNELFVPKSARNGVTAGKDDVFCYTAFGIFPIPRKLIVEANY